MSLTLNVGVVRKVGLPDYSSMGASCSLELELDAGLLDRDPDAFHARVRAVYAAANRAVQEELDRSRSGPETGSRPLPASPRIPAIEAGGRPPKNRPDLSRPGRLAPPCSLSVELEQGEIAVSGDRRGRALDNVFVERLWRSLKYEKIYRKAYRSMR
jgi:hypothetical protein